MIQALNNDPLIISHLISVCISETCLYQRFNDTLYISETIETPYKLSDIKHIKYNVYSEVEKEWGFSDCVRITFHNGDYIDFTDYGDYEAYTKIGTHYLFQSSTDRCTYSNPP